MQQYVIKGRKRWFKKWYRPFTNYNIFFVNEKKTQGKAKSTGKTQGIFLDASVATLDRVPI